MAQQELKVNISGDSSKLNSALSSASSKLSAFGSKMQNVGKSMTTKLTLPLVAVGVAAGKMAFDFDKSMTSITALVGVGADEVAKMGDTAKRMAVDTGKSANEAAEALFFITSAGLRGEEAMGVLEASLKAAAVGLGETKTIADLSTSALNAYGSENLSASGATDILTAAVREGKLEASQLAGAMGGVIPIASNMGVRFDEVAAAMAAMSRTGTNAAEGATQLNAILASLKKPTTDAEMAFQKMGMSTDSVQKSLSEQGLLATLEMLQNGLKQTGQDTTAIFPNIRALKGVLDLTGAGLESNRQIFDSLTKSMGATDEAFEKTSQSASFKMTKSLNAMKSSLIEVGNVILVALVPAVEKIAGFLTSMSDKFKSLSPTMQNAIVGFAGILAIAGPLIIIFGKLAVGLSALGPLLPIVASGFRLLTAAMIANPILAVAAAIAAIGIAILSYSKAQKSALKDSLNISEIEEKISKKRKRLASEQQKIAEGYGGQVIKNVDNLKKEIKELQEKKKVLAKIEKSTKETALATTTPTTTTPTTPTPTSGGGTFVVTPVVDPDAAVKLKAISDEMNKALITNDALAYNARKSEATKYYDNLIKLAGKDSEKQKELVKAKNAAIGVIESAEESRILGIKQKIADSTNTSDAERKKLEIEGIKLHYAELIRLASENGLSTVALLKAQGEAVALVNDEQRASAMERALAFNEGMNEIITGGLNTLAVGIGDAMGKALASGGNLAQSLSKVVLSTIGSMATQLGKLAIGIGIGVEGIKAALKSLNPAVAIAGGIALIALGSFASAQAGKIGGGGGGATAFAKGGIVSGPTMGLVGEYPGAKSNPEVIAPLNKLQGMIGKSGGSQNINVGGQIRLEGQDLLIAIERAQETAGRIY